MREGVLQTWQWIQQCSRRHSSAVGPEALRLVRQEESSESSVSSWQLSRQTAMMELQELFEETSRAGWDGRDAKPLARRARDAVNDALLNLTPHVPIPEIVPEPDGGVAMEWSSGQERSLIVSFGPEGRLYFVVQIPGRRESGRRLFDAQLPSDLLGLAKEAAAEGQ